MGNNPFNELENEPVPVPSLVLLFKIVGEVEVLQQTPRDVTAAPPSLVIVPPLIALVKVIEVIELVDITGRPDSVLNDTSFP